MQVASSAGKEARNMQGSATSEWSSTRFLHRPLLFCPTCSRRDQTQYEATGSSRPSSMLFPSHSILLNPSSILTHPRVYLQHAFILLQPFHINEVEAQDARSWPLVEGRPRTHRCTSMSTRVQIRLQQLDPSAHPHPMAPAERQAPLSLILLCPYSYRAAAKKKVEHLPAECKLSTRTRPLIGSTSHAFSYQGITTHVRTSRLEPDNAFVVRNPSYSSLCRRSINSC